MKLQTWPRSASCHVSMASLTGGVVPRLSATACPPERHAPAGEVAVVGERHGGRAAPRARRRHGRTRAHVANGKAPGERALTAAAAAAEAKSRQ